MSSYTDNNKRIAKNTLVLYIRMLLMMFISLFTTRITLQALGVEDLGIYNVVGGVVVIFDFVSSSLTNATQRYLNIAMGQNNALLAKQYFSQSLLLHIIFAAIILCLGETIGLWFVQSQLEIPANRFNAVFWVYQCSVITVILTLLRMPYNSAIIAHEQMSAFAYLGITESIMRLIIAYIIVYSSFMDKLVLYAVLMLLLPLLLLYSYYKYCIRHYSECKYQYYWDKGTIKEMIGFIGYNSFGCIAWSVGIKGLDILLNVFFGPAVNGARALAQTVNGAVIRFINNIFTAVNPQIIKSYANKDYSYMMKLANKTTKFTFFLIFLISIPIILNTEYILQLWLKEVPEYTVTFTQLSLIEASFAILSNTLWTVSYGTGKIKNIQVYGRTITLLSLPISYLFLKIHPSPYLPIYITIITNLIYWLFVVYDVNRIIKFGICNYTKEVCLPLAYVILLSIIGIYLLSQLKWDNPLNQLLCTTSIITLYNIFIIFLVGINKTEKKLLFEYSNKLIYKLFKK